MARILLTAFEPYETWKANASWLALIDLTRQLPANCEITTRLYPVDLESMKEKLVNDLKSNYDFAFHVGQAPKSSCIQLEEMAVNVASPGHSLDDQDASLMVCDSGPEAYRSKLPVRDWAKTLRASGIPARVSFHAGTFLCNAILYWSCRISEDMQLPTRSTFVHVPLDTSQVLDLKDATAFMPSSMVAKALHTLVQLATEDVPQGAH